MTYLTCRCGNPVDPGPGGGRPRRWCSDKCRADAAVEARKATRGADRAPREQLGLEIRVADNARYMSSALDYTIAMMEWLSVESHEDDQVFGRFMGRVDQDGSRRALISLLLSLIPKPEDVLEWHLAGRPDPSAPQGLRALRHLTHLRGLDLEAILGRASARDEAAHQEAIGFPVTLPEMDEHHGYLEPVKYPLADSEAA